MGDLGYLDEDGFLYLTDGNFVLRGRKYLSPGIEDVLLADPRVADAAFGPDEEFSGSFTPP